MRPPSLTKAQIQAVLDGMAELQHRKVMSLAQELVPGITPEDVRNPHDFQALRASDQFNYEDGTLAGILAAGMALRAEMGESEPDLPPMAP